MRIGFALVAATLLACAGVPVRGSAQSTQTAGSKARAPYTARFKDTTVTHRSDGSTATSEATVVRAGDAQGRRYTAYAKGSDPAQMQVSDPVSLTSSYWAVPGTKATVVHMPDMGEQETDCAKKMNAISPLHPAGADLTQPEDLGERTFLGVKAKGGKISFKRTIYRVGSPSGVTQTNEVWIAADSRLDGLVVHMTMTTSDGSTTTEEMVEFKQGDPDPKLFEVPEGREITRREGQAYICDIKPRPAAATPAK